jgi:proline iminopeptidase
MTSGAVETEIVERLVQVNGTTLWVAEQGAGRPLVLCTGGPGCADYLGPVAAMIDDLARVYRFEPRGCGRSSADGPYDVMTALADLEALRVHLGHERWLLAGHSWGSFLALTYALEYPGRVEAIVDISGAGVLRDREWSEIYHAGREAGREIEPVYAFPPNLEVNRVGNASTKEYVRQPMVLRRIAELDVPYLAIGGEHDIRPNWPTRQLVGLLPNARFELIEGAGHSQWLTHPDELRALLRDFLETLPMHNS